jgi:hypothetical protein
MDQGKQIDGFVAVSLLPRALGPARFGVECPFCELRVTIDEDTDCQHYRGLDGGFYDVRMKFTSKGVAHGRASTTAAGPH